jgi:hypothetical protein
VRIVEVVEVERRKVSTNPLSMGEARELSRVRRPESANPKLWF